MNTNPSGGTQCQTRLSPDNALTGQADPSTQIDRSGCPKTSLPQGTYVLDLASLKLANSFAHKQMFVGGGH